MKIAYTAPLFFLLIMSSCKQYKLTTPLITDNQVSEDNTNKGYQTEALLVDVPVPLYTTRFSIDGNTALSDDTLLGYISQLSVTTIVDFYKNEMERLGWELVKQFGGAETLLIFQTPLRICIVSLKEVVSEQTTIRIYVGTKTLHYCDLSYDNNSAELTLNGHLIL